MDLKVGAASSPGSQITRPLQLFRHGKGLVPRGGGQRPQGGQGGMLFPGLGADSPCPKQPERWNKALAGGEDQLALWACRCWEFRPGRPCAQTSSACRVGRPNNVGAGGAYREAVVGWALPGGPGQSGARTLESGPGFTV